ncbi:MAG: phage portal protein [Clostridia bacterium]|nr:phage portal protein [Clostridia bacterium]
MEHRSLFSRIFGNDKDTTPPETATSFEILDRYKSVFTRYNGKFEDDIDIRTCVDAIARNAAKMHPKHIRRTETKLEILNGNLYRLLSKKPNELQNAFQFYYQVVSELELYNNAYIYIQRDENFKVTGLYPLSYKTIKLYEYKDKLYIQFKFGNKKERFVSYNNCIHLTRFASDDGLFGGSTEPIIKTLSIKHVLDEGIVNAIKTTSAIKGVIKSTQAMLKPEDVKKMRDQFVEDFVEHGDKSGIGGLDATTTFTPINIDPKTADENQIKIYDNKVLGYFGVNENIIQSKYSEDEWNAFYESVLEPIGLQMSLEFSNKIFTPTERYFGNEIIFESNRLQYASNKTKIELLRYANNIMSINELREVFNLTPIDGGETILIDQNHTSTLEDIGGNNEEGN